jgi:hypothetical protein
LFAVFRRLLHQAAPIGHFACVEVLHTGHEVIESGSFVGVTVG